MPQQNVEIVRRVFEAFQAGLGRGDPGAFFDSEDVPADYEVVLRPGFEGRSVWRGRAGFVEFLRTWTEEFDDWSLRVERLIPTDDDRVVALTRQSAVGKSSGAPVEWAMGQVFELQKRRLVRVRFYVSYAEALEAAGLAE